MTQAIETLKKFKTRMTAIGRANSDSLETTVTFDEKGYHILVVERADKHCFLTGNGINFFEAVEDALAQLPDALKDWGYKNVV